MIDRDAVIAEQLAAQKQRDSQPHRYQDVPLKDLGRHALASLENIQSWRETHAQPAALGDAWDGRLRELGAHSQQANAAYGLRSAKGHPVVAIADDGRPLSPPTMDLEQIVSMWSPGGPYADRWPAVQCVEGGFYALMVWGQGVEWLQQRRTVPLLSRRERLDAWAKAQPVDPINELGVPSPTTDWDDGDDILKPLELKPTMSYPLRLVEALPAQTAVPVRSWFGGIRSRAGQAAMAAARGKPPRLMEWMTWRWPKGLALPTGPLRDGVISAPAIPAEGSLLDVGGSRWRVSQWAGEAFLTPPPDWLVSELQGLGNG